MALLKDGSGRRVKRGVHKKVKVFNTGATKWRPGHEREGKTERISMPSLLRSLKQYSSYAAAETFHSNCLTELCEMLLNKNGLKLDDDS